MATSFLKFCGIGSDGVAFVVGVSGGNCAAGVGCATNRVYTGSVEGATSSEL